MKCIFIQRAAIFYYVTVTPFVQFCPTLDPVVLENTTKSFLAIFGGLVSSLILLVINCVDNKPALWDTEFTDVHPEITARINSYHWLSFLEA